MTNISTKKPVNDLIKFWAEKQDKELEPVPRSPRRPLSPTSSLPPSPLNDNFYSKSTFKDISFNTPPLSPTKPFYNNKRSLSEGNNDINNPVDYFSHSRPIVEIQTSSNKDVKDDERIEYISPLPRNEFSNEETSTNITNINNTYSTIQRSRDRDFSIKDNKIGSLPPARKVTDLVSKFEKVTSPTNSVQTSPRLTPVKRSQTYAQSSPTSPLTLSPIKRNQLTPELSLSIPTSTPKAVRRQTVPEPLNFSSKKFNDESSSSSTSLTQNTASNKSYESTPVSPISTISSIGNISIENPVNSNTNTISVSKVEQTPEKGTVLTTKKQYISESQTHKKQTTPVQQQESFSAKDDFKPIKKEVSEPDSNPVQPVITPIKKSDPEPMQQQTRSISLAQSDYLDFVTEVLQNSTLNLTNQRKSKNSSENEFLLPEIKSISPFWKPAVDNTPISPLLNPKKGNTSVSPIRKPVPEKIKQPNTDSQNKTSKNREIAFKTTSNSNSPSSHLETHDLLPHPEPISPIRLSFSDFLISSNGSSTNLNSNSPLDDKINTETSTQDAENENQSHNVNVCEETKSEDPKKNENSSTNKSSKRPISGTIQFIGSLRRRYLQSSKHKSSDDVIASTRKSASKSDNQLY